MPSARVVVLSSARLTWSWTNNLLEAYALFMSCFVDLAYVICVYGCATSQQSGCGGAVAREMHTGYTQITYPFQYPFQYPLKERRVRTPRAQQPLRSTTTLPPLRADSVPMYRHLTRAGRLVLPRRWLGATPPSYDGLAADARAVEAAAALSSAAAPGRAFKLDDRFVQSYHAGDDAPVPPFGFNGLGELVYLRTYSRTTTAADGRPRREQWYQTVRRVVEGCFSLQWRHVECVAGLVFDRERARVEAEQVRRMPAAVSASLVPLPLRPLRCPTGRCLMIFSICVSCHLVAACGRWAPRSRRTVAFSPH